jgi:hypothetical protein
MVPRTVKGRSIGEPMLARLGDVLYWLGCGIAVVILAAGAWLVLGGDLIPENRSVVLAICIGCALAAWLIGRVCRYVLGGR